MDDIVRIGKISTIDYARGTATVIYTDRGNETSPTFPFFSAFYEMPRVDDTVVVLLLPNSTTRGFILGVPYSGARIPTESGQGIFFKEFPDGTYVRYDGKSKQMEVSAGAVMLQALKAESIIVAGNVEAETIIADSLIADSIQVNHTAEVGNLVVSGTAEIVNLAVSGTATGNFPTGSEV